MVPRLKLLPCLVAALVLACGGRRRVDEGDASVAIGVLGLPDAPAADGDDPFSALRPTVTPAPPAAVAPPELAERRITGSELPSIVVSLTVPDAEAPVEDAAVAQAEDAEATAAPTVAERQEAERREAARVEAERAAQAAREAAARAEVERREAAARAEAGRREAAARAEAEAAARAEAERATAAREAAAREAAAREAAAREAAAQEAAARVAAARQAAAREAAAREAAAREAAAREAAAREAARREAAARRAAEEAARQEAVRRAAAEAAARESARRAAAEAARVEAARAAAARVEAARSEAARRAAAEEARRAAEAEARAEAARRAAAETARVEAARRAAEESARREREAAAQREAARRAEEAEAARRAAAEAARAESARRAAAEAAREEAARAEAARREQERVARQEAARRAAAEAARLEAARAAAADAARQEAARAAAARRAAEEAARQEAARRAASILAEQEAHRRAVMLATQQEAARRAEQAESARRAAAEAARQEAARRAAAEAARAEAARAAAAEAARAEAARRAAAEAARRAAAEAARVESARRAAAEAARAEAARRAAEEAARAEAARREQERARAARTPAPAVAAAPAATPPAPRRALNGAWRRLPRVTLTAPRVRARWDDPPDFDGDALPDPILAVEYHAGGVTCRAVASASPCAPVESAPAAEGRPLVLAFVAMFSGDAAAPAAPGAAPDAAAPPTGRLLGTRRFDGRTARVTGAEFSEFGPALVVRTLLEATQGDATDAIDVVDVFTGVGLDRRAGALVHHCVRRPRAQPERHGALAVAIPALAPLVWRAATSHPYSGCATAVDGLDVRLGAPLLGEVRIANVVSARAPAARNVAIAVTGGQARPVTRAERGADTWGDPLALGPVRVLDMTRGCQWDAVRYERDGRRCRVNVPRHGDPLPGCEDRPSPLDPEPPRPLWLHPHLDGVGDGGVPVEPIHLVFARGGELWDATFPLTCQGEHRAHAAPWSGVAPAGVAVSPRGDMVLFGTGDDLWLFTRGRRVPYLLNPPGTALPRLDVRAVAFVDDTHAAAVLSGQFVTFELAAPAEGGGVPGELAVDAAEVARLLAPRR